MRLSKYIAVVVLVLGALTSTAQAAKRVMLVVGNAGYKHVAQLNNPANDAADVSAAFRRLGFQVTTQMNLTGDALRRTLRNFRREAAKAEYAVVYYAGHGLELDRQNYLVPVDAELKSDLDVKYEAVQLDLVMDAVDGASKLKLVLLDACRNNPFAASMRRTSGTRSIGRGLARIEPSVGTLVSFAAKGGTTADDGDGRNSPYTTALLKYVEQPGLELNHLFRQVRDSVLAATNRRQTPFTYGSLPSNRIYLKAPVKKPEVAKPSNNSTAVELAYWNSVKQSNNTLVVQSYLDKFPKGHFAFLARARLREIAALAEERKKAKAAAEQARLDAKNKQKLAALQAASIAQPQASPDRPTAPSKREIARSIQQHLSRLGCNPGKADGDWGARSKRSLKAFANAANIRLASLDPTPKILEMVRSKSKRVCQPARVKKRTKPKVTAKRVKKTPKKRVAAPAQPARKKRARVCPRGQAWTNGRCL